MPNQRRGVFESEAWPAVLPARYEAQAADLERSVVKQAMELEFLKKALQSGPRSLGASTSSTIGSPDVRRRRTPAGGIARPSRHEPHDGPKAKRFTQNVEKLMRLKSSAFGVFHLFRHCPILVEELIELKRLACFDTGRTAINSTDLGFNWVGPRGALGNRREVPAQRRNEPPAAWERAAARASPPHGLNVQAGKSVDTPVLCA